MKTDKKIDRKNKGYYQVPKISSSGLVIWYLFNKKGTYITASHSKHNI